MHFPFLRLTMMRRLQSTLMGSRLELAKSWLPVDSSENTMSGFFLDSENILGFYSWKLVLLSTQSLVHISL